MKDNDEVLNDLLEVLDKHEVSVKDAMDLTASILLDLCIDLDTPLIEASTHTHKLTITQIDTGTTTNVIH